MNSDGAINMERRQQELADLRSYLQKMDKEVTMVLQSLQWDRKHLLQGLDTVYCAYDKNHRVPLHSKEEHEQRCSLRAEGYGDEDRMLPEPFNPQSPSLLKLNQSDITQIIHNAAAQDPSFRAGVAPGLADRRPVPRTADRLLATYTVDERRAIHDAVVARAPAISQLEDLSVLSAEERRHKSKSNLEVLAELRDMKRRPTKYKVGTKSKNYSEVLRDVIKNQMELYSEAHEEIKKEPMFKNVIDNRSKTSCDSITDSLSQRSSQHDIKNENQRQTHYAIDEMRLKSEYKRSHYKSKNSTSFKASPDSHRSLELPDCRINEHSKGSHRDEKNRFSSSRSHSRTNGKSDHSHSGGKRDRYDRASSSSVSYKHKYHDSQRTEKYREHSGHEHDDRDRKPYRKSNHRSQLQQQGSYDRTEPEGSYVGSHLNTSYRDSSRRKYRDYDSSKNEEDKRTNQTDVGSKLKKKSKHRDRSRSQRDKSFDSG